MFNTVRSSVFPAAQQAPYSDKIVFIFRQLIQPWHPSSTLVHEAALAVLKLPSAVVFSPSKRFWSFSALLFEHQKEYFDVNVVNETRNATYKRLARLASDTVYVSEEGMTKLLTIPEKPGKNGELNAGNGVTGDVRTITKMARRVGAHVSPTVFLDGVEAQEISSSWTKEQWLEWLEKNCA